MATHTPEIVLIGNEESADLTLLDLVDHCAQYRRDHSWQSGADAGGVDLVYLGLDLIVSSVETALRHMAKPRCQQARHASRSAKKGR